MGKKRYALNQKGFTIVEIMIAVSILSLLLFYLYSLYGSQMKTEHLINDRGSEEVQAINAINQMVTLIRQQQGSVFMDPATGSLETTDINYNTNSVIIGMNTASTGFQYNGSSHQILDSNNQILVDHVQTFTITDANANPSGSPYHLIALQLIVQKGSDRPYELDTKVFKVDPH